VQLTRDPGPLVADRLGREQCPLGLKLAAAGGELLGETTARRDYEPNRPRADRENEKDRVERGHAVPHLQAGQQQQQRGHRPPLISIGAQRIGEQEDRHRDEVAEAVRYHVH